MAIDPLGYETPQVIELNRLIGCYNEICKDQVSTLSCRIQKLDKIIYFVKDWIENKLSSIDKKKHLQWIIDISSKKKNYLGCLLKIYEEKLYEEDQQETYHFDLSGLKNQSKEPLFLNNQRFFSLKMREFWGDFWFEALDPCHRRLTPFLDAWKALKQINSEIPHFFLWLENQHIPKYVPRVVYLEEAELEKRKLIVNHGLFWEKSDQEWVQANFNKPGKRYLFSINLQEDVYAADEEIGVSHSSFTKGKAVLGAGLLQITEGLLTSIALESGHYMPSIKTGFQILKIFENKGVQFPEKLELVFFYDRNKYKVDILPKHLEDFEIYKETLKIACQVKEKHCYESSK